MGCKNSKSTAVDNTANQPTAETEVYITVEEASGYLVQELGLPEEKAHEIASKCNKNGDGKISKNELTSFVEEVKKIKAQFYEKFAEYDKDNTGFVTTEEAETVIKAELPGFPENRVKGFVGNFAGEDGKINRDEFIHFYAGLKYRRALLEQDFNEMAADDNGEVAAGDVEKVLVEKYGLSERHARVLVHNTDYNKDGKLNKKEFSNAWAQLMGDS